MDNEYTSKIQSGETSWSQTTFIGVRDCHQAAATEPSNIPDSFHWRVSFDYSTNWLIRLIHTNSQNVFGLIRHTERKKSAQLLTEYTRNSGMLQR